MIAPIIFFPCMLILSGITAEGICSVQDHDLVFTKQVGKQVSTGRHDASKCVAKQSKKLVVQKGEHLILQQVEVRCGE